MAEELQTYLLEHFQWLHRHPELALKEYETTNYVKNVLKQTEGVELLNLGLIQERLQRSREKSQGVLLQSERILMRCRSWKRVDFLTVQKMMAVCMLVDMISTRQHFLEWQNFLEERESI